MAMTPEQLLSFTELFYSRNIEIMRRKNADYSGGVADAHANFKALETMSGLDNATAIGFLTRMTDKFMRVVSFVKKGKLEVEDEGVKDSLADLANYCALMAAWLGDQAEMVPQVSTDMPKFWQPEEAGKIITVDEEIFKQLSPEAQKQLLDQDIRVTAIGHDKYR